MSINYLSIDLGDKRCGLAYTNTGIIFTLPMVKRVELVNKLKTIIKEKNIEKIVIGLPYDLYGIDVRQLDKTRRFMEKLGNIFRDIDIIGHDERFTTMESINILREFDSKGVFENKDSMSAFLILESYLNGVK